jgi:hypothetical protein
MIPSWYSFPRLIRDRVGSTTIIISHEYFEKYYDTPMEFLVRNCLTYADYVHVNSWMARDILQDEFNVLYNNISQPIPDSVHQFPESFPFEEKEGIVTLDNSVNTEYVPLFETLRQSDLPVRILTANHTKKSDWCDNLVDVYGIDATVYERLPWVDYINMINKSRVAVAMGYNGICRFAYESANVHTPVVGHNRLEFRNILYPSSTVDNSMEGGEYIKQIYNMENEWKSLNTYADIIVKDYWSIETVNQRLEKLLKKVGYYEDSV